MILVLLEMRGFFGERREVARGAGFDGESRMSC